MEGITLLKTKFVLAEAWTSALRKSCLRCSLFLAALKKTNLPSPLAPLSITFSLGQSYFSKHITRMFRFFSHRALVLPRNTQAGKKCQPEPRLHTGTHFWAFVPGAAHLSLPVSPWLTLRDQDWTRPLCRHHEIHLTPLDTDAHVLATTQVLPSNKGCPCLLVRFCFPRCMLLAIAAIIRKLRGRVWWGLKELNANDSLQASVSVCPSVGLHSCD